MLRDRFVHVLIAAALFGAGLVALYWPTALDAYDRWGFRIDCGSAIVADYDQATIASESEGTQVPNDYVGQCHSAVWWRRGWASVLVLTGAGIAVVLLMRWQREAPAESSAN